MVADRPGEGPARNDAPRAGAVRVPLFDGLAARAGCAVLAFGLGLALAFAAAPLAGAELPALVFLPAILVTAVCAGAGAALAAAAASGGVIWYFFADPLRSFALSGPGAALVGGFALVAGMQVAAIHALARALRRLRRNDAESRAHARSRELMFQELQHRVSNNLGTVASLLRLQRRRVTDAAAQKALDEAHNRIAVIARLQRRLHDPDRQEVDFGRFLEVMARDTMEAAGTAGRVRWKIEADPVFVCQDQAVPLGLIASEFLMNALEHGAAGQGGGAAAVRLVLRHADAGEDGAGRARLEVRDDGPGVPEGFDPAVSGSLGLQIAGKFAEQLGATLEIESHPDGGAVSRLEFPLTAGPSPAVPEEAAAEEGQGGYSPV